MIASADAPRGATPDSTFTALFWLATAVGALGIAVAFLAVRRETRAAAPAPARAGQPQRTK